MTSTPRPTTLSWVVMMPMRSTPVSMASSGVEENTEMTEMSMRSKAMISTTLSPRNPSIQFQMFLFFPFFSFVISSEVEKSKVSLPLP